MDNLKRDIELIKQNKSELCEEVRCIKVTMNTRLANIDRRVNSVEKHNVNVKFERIDKVINNMRYELDFLNGRFQSIINTSVRCDSNAASESNRAFIPIPHN